jgi:hypothetical protein
MISWLAVTIVIHSCVIHTFIHSSSKQEVGGRTDRQTDRHVVSPLLIQPVGQLLELDVGAVQPELSRVLAVPAEAQQRVVALHTHVHTHVYMFIC